MIAGMKSHHPEEHIEDAKLALQMLKDGNERYLKGVVTDRYDYADEREVLQYRQNPYAVILTCADSRVAPEIFLDQKLGDIFTIRNAGNVAETSAMGSIEYAVEHLHSVLVVVIGHTKCGAVTAACSQGDFPPNIKYLVDYIKPAVDKGGDVDEVVQTNVKLMVERIKANETVERLKVTVVGAFYDIHTGVVTWL